MKNCKVMQYSDMAKCETCCLCWDFNDPHPPECPVSENYPMYIEEKAFKKAFKNAVKIVSLIFTALLLGLFLCN